MHKSTPPEGKPFHHLDPSVLENVRAQMPGRPEIIDRIIASFLRSSPGMLAEIRAAVASGDPERVRKSAHAMKSSNGQIGAHQLADLCHQLEVLGGSGELSRCAELLPVMEIEYHGVAEELGRLLGPSQV